MLLDQKIRAGRIVVLDTTPFNQRGADVTYVEAERLLFHEARLIDDWRLEEWLGLYTCDGLYWVPIDDTVPISSQSAIIYAPPLSREERVYQLLYKMRSPMSANPRTVHVITNVVVEQDEDVAVVSSSQVVYAIRPGRGHGRGVGDIVTVVAQVVHRLFRIGGLVRIAEKKVLLINRDTWQTGLTFIF